MGRNQILGFGGKTLVDEYATGILLVSAYRSSWKRLRRSDLRPMAKDFLCDGVNFRWREGFIRSAQRSSADNSFGDEGASFDVCGESSGGICGYSAGIIGLE